ncbi:MAG: M64 family metallopeptidase [Tidjanibacter sp.]|nr:M64 family metallopeptidase [Tidjanibacter sp.]
MKKILILLIALGSTPGLSAQSFDDYFTDRTLRADYIFSGNAEVQFIGLRSLAQYELWAGRRANLDRTAVEGNGNIIISDPESGKVLYKHSFSTLFSEWLGQPEAQTVNRSFEFTALLPYPKAPVDLTVTLLNERREAVAQMKHRIDPTDILIRDLGSRTPTPVKYILKSGSPREKIDVAILAEGYTDSQMEAFLNDAQRTVDAIMSYAPFARHRDEFNFVAVMSASDDTDVSMPGQNRWRSTAVCSAFDTFYSDRYLTTNEVFKINDLLANIPTEHIIILANTEKYGGGGIYNSYTLTNSRNKYFAPVVVHEFGHSFAGLGDEYFYEHDDIATGQYCAEVEPWEPNITTLKDFDSKWRDMLPESYVVPTPATDSARENYTIGVYEGGGYLTHGVYRPTVTCRMRDNVATRFCPVCERAIERVIELN